jgi:hypothetical protein
LIRWHCDNLILELVNVTATVGDESEGASVGTLWIQMVEPHEPVKHQPSGGYMLDNRQVQMTCAKSAGVRLGDRIKFVALAHSSLLSTGDRLANTGLSKQRNREDFDTPHNAFYAPKPVFPSLFLVRFSSTVWSPLRIPLANYMVDFSTDLVAQFRDFAR